MQGTRAQARFTRAKNPPCTSHLRNKKARASYCSLEAAGYANSARRLARSKLATKSKQVQRASQQCREDADDAPPQRCCWLGRREVPAPRPKCSTALRAATQEPVAASAEPCNAANNDELRLRLLAAACALASFGAGTRIFISTNAGSRPRGRCPSSNGSWPTTSMCSPEGFQDHRRVDGALGVRCQAQRPRRSKRWLSLAQSLPPTTTTSGARARSPSRSVTCDRSGRGACGRPPL